MMGANETAAKLFSVNIVKINIIQYVAFSLFASMTSLVLDGDQSEKKRK